MPGHTQTSPAEEVWALLRALTASQKETDRRMQETDRRMQETDRRMQETDRYVKETSREIRELGKQIGGLGKKFGSFTEGLALPSMERILTEQLHMEMVIPSVRIHKADANLEIDVLAYANGDLNQAYVVEVKSHPRQEAIDQVVALLQRFREFFPEHRDKIVYGILTGVDWVAEVKDKALATGLHVATIHDEIFSLQSPVGFQPKAW